MKRLVHILLLVTSIVSYAETRDDRYKIPSTPHSTTPHKVGLFTNHYKYSNYCTVRKSAVPHYIPRKEQDLSQLKFKSLLMETTLQDYIEDNNVSQITVVKDGNIIFQKFQFERNEQDTFTSFSVAKSIISVLIGIAVDSGDIKSLADTVGTYAKNLLESPYRDSTIRNVLRMSSGVAFDETYSAKADIYYMEQDLRWTPNSSVISRLNSYRRSNKNQGKEFNYSSQDTVVLAEVLRSATGKSVCQYMEEKLWSKLGAEADSYWTTDSEGRELGYAYFNARPADYAKIGMMLANKGVFNGVRVLSEDYINQATNEAMQPAAFRVGMKIAVGYGYQFWLNKAPGRFFMQGVYGQYVGVDQQSKTVIVINAVNPTEVTSKMSIATYRLLNKLTELN